MAKFYAIKKGVHPVTKESVGGLILTDWSEAEPYVKGVKGAAFKGFKSRDEAQAYLDGDAVISEDHDPYALYCYVDGSFNEDIPNYSFGLVCVLGGKIVHLDKGLGNNADAISSRQIGGELLGAMKALLFAQKTGAANVVIMHDYQGVRSHATGEWKRSSSLSAGYYNWMQKFFNENSGVSVSFGKVAAHTGDDFNEIADGLAKLAAGLKPNPIFYRIIAKHNVDVA